MKTLTNITFGNTQGANSQVITSKEEWFAEIEKSGWYNGITIESNDIEVLESLLAQLPKYVKAKIRDVSSQFYEETETEDIYYKPSWNHLSIWFTNNSKVTDGANETAVKRANKMFALAEKNGIETQTPESSVYNFYKNNLDLIEEKNIYTKK